MYSLRRYLESYLKEVLQILVSERGILQIKGTANAEKEYKYYVRVLCNLIALQKPLVAITEYLWKVETLGLEVNFPYVMLKGYLLCLERVFRI